MKTPFLLIAYQKFRHSDSMYHTPIGEFSSPGEAWAYIREKGDDLGLNKSEDGGGTYFYMSEDYEKRKKGGFWFTPECNFLRQGEIPEEIYKLYTPY